MAPLYRKTTMLYLYAALFVPVITFSFNNRVTVSMKPLYCSDAATNSATLMCSFSYSDSTYSFFNLEWRQDGVLLADFYNRAVDPNYANYCQSSGNCTITRTNSESYFTISTVGMTENNASYSCKVSFDKGAYGDAAKATTTLVVNGPPVTVSMEPSYHDDPRLHTATLRCNFCVNDATFEFFNLEWKKDGVLVADYFNGAATPNYANYCASSGDCTITRTCTESYFTIASLDRSQNNAVFSCHVVFDKGAERKSGEDTTTLTVTADRHN
ncbi:uncharacterized protein [Asterias amurensis]|uniref:uncharacterized protein n=1 Tax=Asterias amurensis TaxID=7602 RepID=UPI003AB3CB2D